MSRYWILLIILIINISAVFSFSFRRRYSPFYDASLWRPKSLRKHLIHPYYQYHPFQIELQRTLTDLHDQFDSYFMDEQFPKLLADVKDTNGHYEVHVDLPGLNKQDIDISISNNILSVSGERHIEKPDICENIERNTDEFRDECEAIEEQYLTQQRYYGKFETSVILPQDIINDLSLVNAKYIDGVLNVIIPKNQIEAAKDKPYKIKIA